MYIRKGVFMWTPRRRKLVSAYHQNRRLITLSYICEFSNGKPCRHITEIEEFRICLRLYLLPANYIDYGFLARYAISVQQLLPYDTIQTR